MINELEKAAYKLPQGLEHINPDEVVKKAFKRFNLNIAITCMAGPIRLSDNPNKWWSGNYTELGKSLTTGQLVLLARTIMEEVNNVK